MTKRLSILFLIFGTGTAQAANVYNITASAGLMLDDNITRAQYSRDIYDDRAWFVGLTGDYAIPLNDHSRALLTANAESWQYQDSNLGHQIISLQGEYIFQPSNGYTAPWYSIYLQLGLNLNDSEYRDGTFHELGITLGKRLTDATSLRAGFSRHSDAADSDNFSTDSSQLYGNLDFKFDQDTAYTTLAYTSGDIVATVGDQGYSYPPALAGMYHTGDDAFPWLNNAWAYKLDADTWSLRLGYVHVLAGNQSIDASILRYQSSAYGGNDYDGMIVNIIYFYRF
jgi:hypothetical protein